MVSLDAGLLEEQKVAASHRGRHCRLLAGPGTGKTFTLMRRVAFLLSNEGIAASDIAALTFTRVATAQLKQAIREYFSLWGEEYPLVHVSTLHSFALRQLLRNADTVTILPKPLKIADDWEEKNIIIEELKTLCQHSNVRETRGKLGLLAAGWDSLDAEDVNWEQQFSDPNFIGAWREHRQVYGYTLRSELVYQLKRALERDPDFKLEDDFKHLVVDEYQDLNKCDQSVIKVLASRGAELFVAGDDDQSIYGFRKANPNGIRDFLQEYEGAQSLTLEFCKRCDKSILALAEFVADLDPRRLPKSLKPLSEAAEGEVKVLNFMNQYAEAEWLAQHCKQLVFEGGYKAQEILVLLRSDFQDRYSSVLIDAFQRNGVPIALNISSESPIDNKEGREFVTLLRLCLTYQDSLAWRTLLEIRKNNIGSATIRHVYNLARTRGTTFAESIGLIENDPGLCSGFGARLATEIGSIKSLVQELSSKLGGYKLSADSESNIDELVDALGKCSQRMIQDSETRKSVDAYLEDMIRSTGANSLSSLLANISIVKEADEQHVTEDAVNIMTMHKAKGLSADVVFVVAAEDEVIPGPQIGEDADDERRLLYVSLTRARHKIFVTYCRQRVDGQMYSGRNRGQIKRTLTQFLQDAPVKPTMIWS